jgi:sugar phosphate isomerase/epimerase
MAKGTGRAPARNGRIEMTNIIASYWTVAGDVYPGCGAEASPRGFRERYETAARLGYAGAGFVYDDLIRARDIIGYAELRRLLEVNGIADIEVEILTDWFADGERRRVSDEIRRDLLKAGEAIGARHLKVSADFQTKELNIDRMAESFAGLCADAARIGLPVGIEVMPFTNISTVKDARAVVERSGAANGGLLLDIWLMERAGVPFDDIAALPASMIISVEINDAAANPEGDLWNDTLHHRLPCGQGTFDIDGFLRAVAETGYAGPVGAEIISAHHRKLPLEEAARIAIESARPYVARMNDTVSG